jgi:transcription-repair coupling factor (superfamily II helicase)
VELAPVSEVILDEAAITRFRQNYRIEFGAAGTDDPLYEAVSAGRKHAGAEHWLPFFHERLETIFDYLPGATVTLDDQTTPQRIARWEAITDQYDTRATALSQKGRLDTVYKPVPPGQLYLDEAAWDRTIAGRRVVQFSPLAQSPGRASSTRAGAWDAISRPSVKARTSTFSGPWRIIFARFGRSGR